MPCLCGAVDCPSCNPWGPAEDPVCSGCWQEAIPGQDGAVEDRQGRVWCQPCQDDDEGTEEPSHEAV